MKDFTQYHAILADAVEYQLKISFYTSTKGGSTLLKKTLGVN